MEQLQWATYVAAIVLSVYLLNALAARLRRKLNLPPGPKPWPIIGNLDLIGHLPHRSIHALSQKYGPLMQLRLGSSPVVVGSSVEMARFFLKTHDLSFASRPKTAAGKYTTYNYSDITWSPYGAYWRQARKICVMELFCPRRLESSEQIRVEEVHSMMGDLFRSSGRPVILKEHLFTASLNIISRMVLGKNYLNESESLGGIVSPMEFREMLDELFLLNGVMNIGDFIPWLDFLDLQGYIKRMKTVSRKFDRFMEHVVDEHNERRRRERQDFVPRDMVDVLLQLADDPNLDVKFERHSVKAFTQDLIAGGTESSSMTVEWAISELLRHPAILEKATEELDRVVGRGRWVEEKDVRRLPYIEAIIKETFRMHPIAPILLPRLAREDVRINGYDIPAGTRVLVSAWSVARDPSFWEVPEEFRPERFVVNSIDVKGNDLGLLPFGAGRRMCPGYSLGLKVIQLSLANLLHGFTWRLPGEMKAEDLSMEEVFGLSTTRKVPLEVVVEPKLQADLYGVY